MHRVHRCGLLARRDQLTPRYITGPTSPLPLAPQQLRPADLIKRRICLPGITGLKVVLLAITNRASLRTSLKTVFIYQVSTVDRICMLRITAIKLILSTTGHRRHKSCVFLMPWNYFAVSLVPLVTCISRLTRPHSRFMLCILSRLKPKVIKSQRVRDRKFLTTLFFNSTP